MCLNTMGFVEFPGFLLAKLLLHVKVFSKSMGVVYLFLEIGALYTLDYCFLEVPRCVCLFYKPPGLNGKQEKLQ